MLPLRPGARPAKSPSLPSLESCWCWPMPCSATAPLTKHGQTPFVQKPLDTLHSYLLRCAACAARTLDPLHWVGFTFAGPDVQLRELTSQSFRQILNTTAFASVVSSQDQGQSLGGGVQVIVKAHFAAQEHVGSHPHCIAQHLATRAAGDRNTLHGMLKIADHFDRACPERSLDRGRKLAQRLTSRQQTESSRAAS